MALWRAGRAAEATALCEAALRVREDAEVLNVLAELHAGAGRHAEAASSLRRLAALRPHDAAVHRRLGNALQASSDHAAAISSYRASLEHEPRNPRAWNNLGQSLFAGGDLALAQESYEHALQIDPRYAIALNNLGILRHARHEYTEALACYERALASMPTFAQAHHNRGNTLLALERAAEALGHFDRALALRPSPDSHGARGRALQQLERFEEALASYEAGLALRPQDAALLSDCAAALLELKRPQEALRRCEQALALNPDLSEAHCNRGGALMAAWQVDEAYAACVRAIELKPASAHGWNNIAGILLRMGRTLECIECCDQAIALQPELFKAHERRGTALARERRPREAQQAFATVLRLKPQLPYALGNLFNAHSLACDWSGYDGLRADLARGVLAGDPVVPPFVLLSAHDDPALHLRCARDYAARDVRGPRDLPWPEPEVSAPPARERTSGERIRVAYLSADFHHHATAMLAAGMFESHDRSRFETIAVSFGPEDRGVMRERLTRAFDRFIEVRRLSDTDVVRQLRELRVDIAVDLKGYTGDSRPELLAARCAPLQVSYLGYPGTTGMGHMDYVVADRIVLPPEDARHYTERIVWLPDCYQVNDGTRAIAERTPTRAELGLPQAGFVFCSFNSAYKITPEVFDGWMGLLRQLPGSVLWLLGDAPEAMENLRREAAARDVDPARLVFAPRAEIADHLARHRCADLFLDTLPYNAHTTASDALWAGLPVLTCLGRAFAGRVAASLLQAVGLPELITHTRGEYTARALELARDPARLARLHAKLAANRLSQPLFDTGRFCRHLERAYVHMWQRHRQGLPPESFAVSAVTP